MDADELLARGGHVLADVVGPDRDLAVAAIDEDRQADGLRPAEVDEGIHRRPDRPARVQDVVDEDDGRAVQVERQVGALDDRLLGDQREVVAVERDVERADRQADALVLEDGVGDPVREGDARRWIPIRASPAVPACFSTISWLIRIVARRISSAVMIWRPVMLSFPASQNRSLKVESSLAQGQ